MTAVVPSINEVFEAGVEAGLWSAWEEAYRAGWAAAEDVITSRIALQLENGLPDLSAGRQYADMRPPEWAAGVPCTDPGCGACGVRRGWLERHGRDFQGIEGVA